MKYKKLTLSINYEKYSEQDKDNLNSFKKNSVYYSLGEFFIYVDFTKIDEGKAKLLKSANKKFNETINNLK